MTKLWEISPLTDAANAVTTLAGNTGSVNFTDSQALTIGTVNATTGLTTTGNAQLASEQYDRLDAYTGISYLLTGFNVKVVLYTSSLWAQLLFG